MVRGHKSEVREEIKKVIGFVVRGQRKSNNSGEG